MAALQAPLFKCAPPLHFRHPHALGGHWKSTATSAFPISHPIVSRSSRTAIQAVVHRMKAASPPPIDEIPPNALRRKRDPLWSGGFSLGLDWGLSRTGLALSKGFSVRPLTVLEMRGQKLELRIMEIAAKEEVDEFVIGLPRSSDGKETPQSNKVRSVAGRIAVLAAERGWRVYLQDEHGTSDDAMQHMIDMGLSKSTRQGQLDAYAATMVLERYFSTSGEEVELVWPKQLDLQEKLRSLPVDDDSDELMVKESIIPTYHPEVGEMLRKVP